MQSLNMHLNETGINFIKSLCIEYPVLAPEILLLEWLGSAGLSDCLSTRQIVRLK